MSALSIKKLAALACRQFAFILHCAFFNTRNTMPSDYTQDLNTLNYENINYENLENFGPRFFTPYEDAADVVDTLVRPFYAPFLLAAFTAIAAVVAAVAFALSLICLVLAFGASIFGADEARAGILDFAGVCFLVSLAATVATPILAVLTVASPVIGLFSIFSRTGTSIVSAIADGFADDDESSESFGEDSASTPFLY